MAENTTTVNNSDEVEIDILEICRLLRSKIWIILILRMQRKLLSQ